MTNKLSTLLKHHSAIVITVATISILYAAIAIVNHYLFRTYALDYGAYTNALYDYVHFQWNDSGVFRDLSENLLADHFDLYLIILSPFSFIFGTYTLLIFQLLSVLLGGVGVYRYFTQSGRPSIALFGALHYFLFFGIYGALSCDYHSNVIAVSLIPWFFLIIRKQRVVAASVLLFFILIAKENMGLWLTFICLALAIEYRNTIKMRNYLIIASTISALYFALVISILMPSMANPEIFRKFNYSVLGNSYVEAFLYLLSHPFDTIKVLFVNHTHQPQGDYVKAELFGMLCLSGLPILLRKPHYLLMLIPIFFQKLYHDNYIVWGIAKHYTIEFAPILSIGIFSVIGEFRKLRVVKAGAIMILASTAACTIHSMDSTIMHTPKAQLRVYQKQHFTRDYDVALVHQQLDLIPREAVVSAQSPFLPHLSLRDYVYEFPKIKDAEYIVYSFKEDPYPATEARFDSITTALSQSQDWQLMYEGDIVVLKRR
jgi:uncharacterized membrane protein